jgi:hypothetical protein
MKTFLISASVILAIVFIFKSFIMASVNKTEEQNYTVIQKDQNFEIRFYPSATFATIKSDAKTYKELSGPGFRKLADYIFGGNEDKTQIAMTSPVQMDINDTVSTMSFVMPSSYNQANLPKPNNPDVILKETADEYVAAIQFGGFASDKELKFYSEKLLDILKEKGIKTQGNTRFLAYNPPFQLVGRRNEIVISIEYK